MWCVGKWSWSEGLIGLGGAGYGKEMGIYIYYEWRHRVMYVYTYIYTRVHVPPVRWRVSGTHGYCTCATLTTDCSWVQPTCACVTPERWRAWRE